MPKTVKVDERYFDYCTENQRKILDAIILHGGAKAAELQKRLHAAEAEHSTALGRWMELDARKEG